MFITNPCPPYADAVWDIPHGSPLNLHLAFIRHNPARILVRFQQDPFNAATSMVHAAKVFAHCSLLVERCRFVIPTAHPDVAEGTLANPEFWKRVRHERSEVRDRSYFAAYANLRIDDRIFDESVAARRLVNVGIGYRPDPDWCFADPERFREKLEALLRVPTMWRFLDLDPLPAFVQPASIEPFLYQQCSATKAEHDREHDGGMFCTETSINWVVVGGGSSAAMGAPSINIKSIVDVVDLCRRAETPYYVTQLGPHCFQTGVGLLDDEDPDAVDVCPLRFKDGIGADPEEWPEALRGARVLPPGL